MSKAGTSPMGSFPALIAGYCPKLEPLWVLPACATTSIRSFLQSAPDTSAMTSLQASGAAAMAIWLYEQPLERRGPSVCRGRYSLRAKEIPRLVQSLSGLVVRSSQLHFLSFGASNFAGTGSMSQMLANTSVEATNCSELQFAPHLERVCRAWHESRWVKVPVPGISRAEG